MESHTLLSSFPPFFSLSSSILASKSGWLADTEKKKGFATSKKPFLAEGESPEGGGVWLGMKKKLLSCSASIFGLGLEDGGGDAEVMALWVPLSLSLQGGMGVWRCCLALLWLWQTRESERACLDSK